LFNTEMAMARQRYLLLTALLLLVLAALPASDSASDLPHQPNLLKRFVTAWREWHGTSASRSSTSALLRHRRYLSADPADAADVARVLRRRGGWWHDADGQAYVSTAGDETVKEVVDDVAEGFVARRRRKLAAGDAKGPCTPLAEAKLVTVTTEEDIAKRKQYSNKETVILELANDITLTKGIVFDAAYRCTIFRSSAGKTNYKISYMGDREPLLQISNTSNVIILRINFWMGVSMSSPECTDFLYTDMGMGNTCPTILLWRVHNTQVAKGFVYGRIDVIRAMSSRIDNMKGTGLPLFVKSPGVIRVSFSGYGPALLKSWVAISNNEVYGVDQPITLLNGAVGVMVRRNYIHDFLFAGIRCGADVHNQGDCMLTTISNNLIVASGLNMSGDRDAAGIYYCTHFFNPGNVAECNYIFNGDHCYYLDYVSSGIIIRGGACVNTFDGMKVNNGKWNVITDVIMKGTQNLPGWVACFTPTSNNCLKHSGEYWEQMRLKYYNTPAILKAYPWFPTVCKERTINGYPCNIQRKGTLSGLQTGYCSGLPTNNTLKLITVQTSDHELGFRYCERRLPTVESGRLNTYLKFNISRPPRAKFANYHRNDFGVTSRESVIYKKFPNFKNCPRSTVGQKRVPDSFYYGWYNRPMPFGFMAVLNMGKLHIHDSPGWP
ncbi:hypothetical protein CLOP_g3102, partial [Closterium sp. NIES-67]